MATKKGRGPLKTTQLSIDIIEAIQELDGARLPELAEHLDISTSAAHEHLQTLIANRYVIKEGSTYHIGIKLFSVGEYARSRKQEYQIARRKAHQLSERVGEEANYSVEEYGRKAVLFDEESNPSTSGFQTGKYFYLHTTAAGKAILSQMNQSNVENVIDRWGLPQITEHSITDRDELEMELEQVRKQGYAVNDEEAIEGLRAVGMPVLYPNGDTAGALDISGPTYRLPPVDELADELSQIVDELEDEIRSLYGS